MMIFSIGHSRHAAEHFVELLRTHAIEQIADVRSQPRSKWAPHFDKGALAQLLCAHGIDYVFLGRQLGGRPEGRQFYRDDGSVDYALRAAASDFQAGIQRLIELSRGRQTAIMCAEEDPARCHRRLLVAPALRLAGLEVVHIRSNGHLEPDASDPVPMRQLDLWS